MFNKLIRYLIITPVILLSISSFCLWQEWYFRINGELNNNFPYQNTRTDNLVCDGGTDLWNCTSVKEDEKRWWEETIIRRLLWVFGLDTSTGKDLKFIDYARAIMNIALGLVAFIALIMTIYTFYMIFFSENEAWIKKAKENLTGIFIALAIIWLAWLIVSFIFWWYQSNWKLKEENIRNLDISEVWEFWNR
jgi:hypothetical protein